MAKPKVLLIHGGGFVGGSPDDTRKDARWLRRKGYRPIRVEYPMGRGTRAAFRAVKRVAKETGATGAIGYSAGGHLAERLAERGKVKRAVAISPPHAPTWERSRAAVKRDLGLNLPKFLPKLNPDQRSGKTYIFHNPKDPWAMYRSSRKYADRERSVRLRTIRKNLTGNPHVPAASQYRPAVRRILQKLK